MNNTHLLFRTPVLGQHCAYYSRDFTVGYILDSGIAKFMKYIVLSNSYSSSCI